MAPLPRRIVLTGSESTGKTTLAAGLAERLGTIWVPEFAREYAEARGGVLSAADLEPIGRGQRATELAALTARDGPVVFDTDLVSTALYGRYYYGLVVPWIEQAIAGYPPSRYLCCDVDLPWEPDGVRDRGDDRARLNALFRATLEERGLWYRVIRGAGPERIENAILALEED